MIQIFKEPSKIIKKLKQHGYEAYFVGGSVRDFLMNRPIGDIDIATSALPEEVMALFKKHVPIGLQHGTILVIEGDGQYEVTTFRVEEEYHDFRRPSEVTFVRHLQEDLKRRDFTMNAIAMTEDGQIIDLYEGREDIAKGNIRTVGSASERFSEDALRMMRALRFVSTLGFTLHSEVIEGIDKQKSLLSHIAVERLLVEMDKLIRGEYVQQGIEWFCKLEIYNYVPFLVNNPDHLSKLNSFPLHTLQIEAEFWTLLLFLDNQKEAEQVAKSWRMSNKRRNEINTLLTGLIKVTEKGWNNRLRYELGEKNICAVTRLYQILAHMPIDTTWEQEVYRTLPIKNRKEIVVTGKDVLTWTSKKPGPWIQYFFSDLEDAILNREVENRKEVIREWFLEWQQM